jgi:hypothetical protein
MALTIRLAAPGAAAHPPLRAVAGRQHILVCEDRADQLIE